MAKYRHKGKKLHGRKRKDSILLICQKTQAASASLIRSHFGVSHQPIQVIYSSLETTTLRIDFDASANKRLDGDNKKWRLKQLRRPLLFIHAFIFGKWFVRIQSVLRLRLSSFSRLSIAFGKPFCCSIWHWSLHSHIGNEQTEQRIQCVCSRVKQWERK